MKIMLQVVLAAILKIVEMFTTGVIDTPRGREWIFMCANRIHPQWNSENHMNAQASAFLEHCAVEQKEGGRYAVALFLFSELSIILIEGGRARMVWYKECTQYRLMYCFLLCQLYLQIPIYWAQLKVTSRWEYLKKSNNSSSNSKFKRVEQAILKHISNLCLKTIADQFKALSGVVAQGIRASERGPQPRTPVGSKDDNTNALTPPLQFLNHFSNILEIVMLIEKIFQDCGPKAGREAFKKFVEAIEEQREGRAIEVGSLNSYAMLELLKVTNVAVRDHNVYVKRLRVNS